jgi:hypothetical protein
VASSSNPISPRVSRLSLRSVRSDLADLLLLAGHFEKVPYDDRTIRSVYHIRQYDVARLLQVNRSSLGSQIEPS